jgi:hypothetical protein
VSGSSVVPDGSGRVPLSWTAQGALFYDIQAYPTGTPVGQECSALGSHCVAVSPSASMVFPLTSGISAYTWRVRAVNVACSPSGVVSPWSSATFTVSGGFTGGFYDDSGTGQATLNTVTGVCEATGLPLIAPGAAASIRAQAGSTVTPGVITGSTYSITGVSSNPNTIVSLSPDPTQFACSCPVGCSYAGLSASRTGVNFYLTSAKQAWWQTKGGLLYAGAGSGMALQSLIPATCASPLCTPALLTTQTAGSAQSAGYAFTGGGGMDTTPETDTALSRLREGGESARVVGAHQSGPKEDYTYFQHLLSVSPTQSSDFTGQPITSPPTNGVAYYASSDVTISRPLLIAKGQRVIILMNGSLTVSAPISVDRGGFLMIITKGNITFSNQLGSTDQQSTTPVVSGIFLSDGVITVQGGRPGGDLKFVAEGSYIGYGGVSLGRTRSSLLDNATTPMELFLFRSEFAAITPESLTTPLTLWQEVN